MMLLALLAVFAIQNSLAVPARSVRNAREYDISEGDQFGADQYRFKRDAPVRNRRVVEWDGANDREEFNEAEDLRRFRRSADWDREMESDTIGNGDLMRTERNALNEDNEDVPTITLEDGGRLKRAIEDMIRSQVEGENEDRRLQKRSIDENMNAHEMASDGTRVFKRNAYEVENFGGSSGQQAFDDRQFRRGVVEEGNNFRLNRDFRQAGNQDGVEEFKPFGGFDQFKRDANFKRQAGGEIEGANAYDMSRMNEVDRSMRDSYQGNMMEMGDGYGFKRQAGEEIGGANAYDADADSMLFKRGGAWNEMQDNAGEDLNNYRSDRNTNSYAAEGMEFGRNENAYRLKRNEAENYGW